MRWLLSAALGLIATCAVAQIAPKFLLLNAAPGWVIAGALADWDFENARYYGCPPASCLTFTRAAPATTYGYGAAGNLNLTPFTANIPRIVPGFGLLLETGATNITTSSRDLTNAAWVLVNVTTLKDQTGVDGTANAASSLTAGASCAVACTVLQTQTLGSSSRTFSAYVKRVSGSGTLSITTDNLVTPLSCGSPTTYTRCTITTAAVINPVFGFSLSNGTDVWAVDFAQNETTGGVPVATSPFDATTRSNDQALLAGSILTAMQGQGASVLAYMQGVGATPTTTIRILAVNTATTSAQINGLTSTATVTRSLDGSNLNGINATLGSSGTIASTFKTAVSWSSGARAAVANNGTVVTSAAGVTGVTAAAIGGTNGAGNGTLVYRRMTFFASQLDNTALKNITVP